jgi:DNA-binding response OmpR family regulator
MRILLVEDDPAQTDAYRRILESLGCAMLVASTAETGLELARAVAFDAILTDNVLAGMSGLRSIAEYAKSTKAPVLMMTSHFSADLEKDALLLGAKRVFAKPLAWDSVIPELAALSESNA